MVIKARHARAPVQTDVIRIQAQNDFLLFSVRDFCTLTLFVKLESFFTLIFAVFLSYSRVELLSVYKMK